MNARETLTFSELEQWLDKHRVTEIECLVPDLTGVARGKILPREKFTEDRGMRLPEAVVARHGGLRVLGISTISNVAIDNIESEAETTHQEVLETGKLVVPRLTALLQEILSALPVPGESAEA